MDRKTIFLAFLALVLCGASMLYKLDSRQRRRIQPYLTQGIRIGAPVLTIFLVLGVTLVLKRQGMIRQQRQAIDQAVAGGVTWLLLRPKEARPIDVEKVNLWKRLAYAQPSNEHFSFEAYGNSDQQGLAIHASQTKIRAVLREFFQEWPDLQRRPISKNPPTQVPEGWHVHWVEVGPALIEKPITSSSRDPLLAVLSEIADVPAPTRALLQVIARSDTATRRQLGEKSAAIRASEVKNTGVRYQRTREANVLEARGARLFLQVVIRVSAISPVPERARGVAKALAYTLCNQFGPDNPIVVLAEAKPRKSFNLADRSIRGGAIRSWADDEVVALAHLPGGDALKYAPLLITGSAKSLPAKPELRIPLVARRAYFESRILGEAV